LGLPRWRISLQLIVPAAVPGVITGALLAVARAAGETAPLLFTALGAHILVLDPSEPMQALPVTVFKYALLPYKSLQDQAWGAALVLIMLVLVINLTSRWVLRRQIALAGQL
jgi:phosphate transport system permease protein